jgi:hypothetical protein
MPTPRAAHGEVVHGAVDRQVADRPTREDQRADDVRVRGKGQARAADPDDRAIVPGGQLRVEELGQKDLLNELLAQLAPAAMRQQHLVPGRQEDGAGQLELLH